MGPKPRLYQRWCLRTILSHGEYDFGPYIYWVSGICSGPCPEDVYPRGLHVFWVLPSWFHTCPTGLLLRFSPLWRYIYNKRLCSYDISWSRTERLWAPRSVCRIEFFFLQTSVRCEVFDCVFPEKRTMDFCWMTRCVVSVQHFSCGQ